MKAEQLQDLLRYRMEQAHETLREAKILLYSNGLLPAGQEQQQPYQPEE